MRAIQRLKILSCLCAIFFLSTTAQAEETFEKCGADYLAARSADVELLNKETTELAAKRLKITQKFDNNLHTLYLLLPLKMRARQPFDAIIDAIRPHFDDNESKLRNSLSNLFSFSISDKGLIAAQAIRDLMNKHRANINELERRESKLKSRHWRLDTDLDGGMVSYVTNIDCVMAIYKRDKSNSKPASPVLKTWGVESSKRDSKQALEAKPTLLAPSARSIVPVR